jgi:broad specificity phosphatase PhoE
MALIEMSIKKMPSIFNRAFLPRLCAAILMLFLAGVSAHVNAAGTDEATLLAHMRGGGAVLMIRHALAPGTGDPDHFQLNDCTTQRNLNDTGRQQARAIGDWLRARGITSVNVYSSQWCRCLETAKLLDLGAVTELPALNSFFERPQDREPNLTALRTFIREQANQQQLTILVTHQVTISGITNQWTDSGHAKLIRQGDDGQIVLLGQLSFGD